MPYISAHVNCAVDGDTEERLKQKLGETISLLPGKSERWLMVELTDNCRLWFQGRNDSRIAFVSVRIYGSAEKKAYDRLTAGITEAMGEVLSIRPENIYVQYEECEVWGWNGSNF